MVIYQIKNLITKQIYIGSSSNFLQRKRQHKTELNRNIHKNRRLQNSFNKYGTDNFEYSILEIVKSEDNLISREQFYLDTFKPFYNIRKVADRNVGIKKSRESIERQAKCLRKKVLQFTKTNEFIYEWNSLREASTALNISESGISNCCNGRLRSSSGFIWKFKDLYIPYKTKGRMSSAEASKLNGQKFAKFYRIEYKDGSSKIIKNFSAYCRDNNLDRGLYKTYIGKDTMDKLGYSIKLVDENSR